MKKKYTYLLFLSVVLASCNNSNIISSTNSSSSSISLNSSVISSSSSSFKDSSESSSIINKSNANIDFVISKLQDVLYSSYTLNYYYQGIEYNDIYKYNTYYYNDMSKQGSLHNIKLVDISEFQSILQRYYGFQYIDLENVMPKTTLKNTLGDSRVIRSSSNIAGNWVNSKQPTETVLVKGFYDNPYVEVADIGEDITNNIPELDIFKD